MLRVEGGGRRKDSHISKLAHKKYMVDSLGSVGCRMENGAGAASGRRTAGSKTKDGRTHGYLTPDCACVTIDDTSEHRTF